MLLIFWWNQTTTIRTTSILLLMLFTVARSPLIYQVFTDQGLITIRTTWRNTITKTFGMIGCSLMYLETCLTDRASTGGTDEVLGMPRCAKCGKIVAPDWSSATFTDWLYSHIFYFSLIGTGTI